MPVSSTLNESEDDFIVIDDNLPIRSKQSNGNTVTTDAYADEIQDDRDSDGVSLSIHPIHASEEVLVSIRTPHKPDVEPGVKSGEELHHTNCDIVLVIDVSGSMGTSAELPDNIDTSKKEFSGLSILDLVKHASRAVLESLNRNDRLAIVTFSNDATRVQELSSMTLAGKALAWQKIQKLEPQSSTNLWSGIREGLEVFNSTKDIGNVQSMFILTDGEPNYMCPTQGYVKKLQPMLKEMETLNGHTPTLSTFGFGYHLKSDLMRSIAEVGRGSYAFIPDSGMIGTVFVHAVANLFSTFATSLKLRLHVRSMLASVSAPQYLDFETDKNEEGIVINLEKLQYGQSRDIVVKLDNVESGDVISCTLEYHATKHGQATISAERRFSDRPTVSRACIDYHLSRHRLCEFIAGFSTLNKKHEHTVLPASKISKQAAELEPLINSIKLAIDNARQAHAKEEEISLLLSVLADLEHQDGDADENPHGAGQISLAIKTTKLKPTDAYAFYDRWGKHYLPSVLHAHMRQQCATFKDPGPLCYGSKSPLFIKCRDEIDAAFDKLPAPKPSIKGQKIQGGVLHMSRYNSRSNPCFAGHCAVKLGDGASGSEMQVDELRVGDTIWTPIGGRMVRGIIKTDVALGDSQVMCNFSHSGRNDGGLWVTPYHPIQIQGQWDFPVNVDVPVAVMKTGFVYSIILEKDEDANAHVVDVGGILCVTLGHGIVSDTVYDSFDARIHPYLGDYDRVYADIQQLDKDDCGKHLSGGMAREEETGLATRFLRLDEVSNWDEYLRARL